MEAIDLRTATIEEMMEPGNVFILPVELVTLEEFKSRHPNTPVPQGFEMEMQCGYGVTVPVRK